MALLAPERQNRHRDVHHLGGSPAACLPALSGVFTVARFALGCKIMLTLKDVQNRLGMGEWPVRRLLDALAPLLQGQLHRKPGQPMQVDSAALGLLERAKALMDQGVTRANLVQVMQGELQGLERAAANGRADGGNSVPTNDDLVAALRQTIERLERDNDWLKARLEERMAALPEESQGRRMGRLAHLRAAILGR